jgi:DNA-binding NarL/FixJ family response regulator
VWKTVAESGGDATLLVMAIRVLIVEEQSINRAGIRSHLQTDPGIELLGEVGDAAAGLSATMSGRPDVVVLGASLMRKQGDPLLGRLLGLGQPPAVLVLAEHEDAWIAERALRGGALGFLSNEVDAQTLTSAVRQVARQEVVLHPRLSGTLLRRLAGGPVSSAQDPPQLLSEREMEVFTLTGQGLEAKEIASELAISPRTVDVHRANIRAKLRIQGTHELMRKAMQWEQQRRHDRRLHAFCRERSPLLLVEDDEVDILSVERALRELGTGTRLVVARTADEALCFLRSPENPRPGLVLLDLKLPGMNGGEFLAEIRRDPALQNLPVVILTASRLEEDKVRMYALGIAGYLAKPASPAEFVEMVGLLAQYWSLNEAPPPAAAKK